MKNQIRKPMNCGFIPHFHFVTNKKDAFRVPSGAKNTPCFLIENKAYEEKTT